MNVKSAERLKPPNPINTMNNSPTIRQQILAEYDKLTGHPDAKYDLTEEWLEVLLADSRAMEAAEAGQPTNDELQKAIEVAQNDYDHSVDGKHAVCILPTDIQGVVLSAAKRRQQVEKENKELTSRLIKEHLPEEYKSWEQVWNGIVQTQKDRDSLKSKIEELEKENAAQRSWIEQSKKDNIRDGKWIDVWGACKVCDGEIPNGHIHDCDIYKLEHSLSQHQAALKAAQERIHELENR